MDTPKRIFLIDMGDDIIWSGDKNQLLDEILFDEDDSVEYIRKDCTYRESPCKYTCESKAFEIELRSLRNALLKKTTTDNDDLLLIKDLNHQIEGFSEREKEVIDLMTGINDYLNENDSVVIKKGSALHNRMKCFI